MKRSSIILRKTLLAFMLFLLFIPLLQNNVHFVKVHALKGSFVKPIDDFFSVKEWLSGNFQKHREVALNDEFGFREIFVRLNNQLLFNLFNETTAAAVIIGKDNYLYEDSYIQAYYGNDFIGVQTITDNVKKLKFIQDTLAKLNKTFLLVFGPGKASFYPEYIPTSYQFPFRLTNYQSYITLAKAVGLHYIDFRSWFLNIKTTSPYPLFPKYGAHWSFYGICLTGDSIIKYVEQARHINMPHIGWDHIDMDYPKYWDVDIEDAMNLVFNLHSGKMAYPHLVYGPETGKTKPSVLVIGDSYFSALSEQFKLFYSFSKSDFWYYNRAAFGNNSIWASVDKKDLKEEVSTHDVFIILASNANIHSFGWGIIDELYDFFRTGKVVTVEKTYDQRLKETMDNIQGDEHWMEDIEAKAHRNGIAVDTQLKNDAIWILKRMDKQGRN